MYGDHRDLHVRTHSFPTRRSSDLLFGEAVLPQGATYTFWGKGLSQGHSDAVRRIPGVKAAVQYTIPVDDAVNRVRSGELPSLSTRQRSEEHTYELQSLMRISYAVFCLKKKKTHNTHHVIP